MIKGTYIFYEDGKEIYRSSNVITKFGKRFLTNLIAGNEDMDAKSLAFGIDDTTATDMDTRLGFEFYRVPVSFGSTDIQPGETTSYSVVYKATIPQDVIGTVKEVGLYPEFRQSTNIYDSKFITEFDSQLDWTNVVVPSATGATIGANLLVMDSDSGVAKEYKSDIAVIDFSGYSVNDSIRLAYYKNDNNLASIKLRFYSSATAYYEVTITPASGTGNRISSDILMSTVFAGATSPAPDPTNINKIGIIITPTSGIASVGMDALRINDEDTFDPSFGLISRSVLATPLVKLAGRPVDVEYRLDLGF